MSAEQKTIPKIIHYCWFGKEPLSKRAQDAIASWKKHCPDYEIRQWNEENFDINIFPYVREAYKEKRWAFVSDVARLLALRDYGGVYLDTDVELLKPLDFLLDKEVVFGMENQDRISTAVILARKNNKLIRELLATYKDIRFDSSITNVQRFTDTIKNNNEVTILSKDYFCPKDYESGFVNFTSNTVAIHFFDQSWKTPEEIDREDMFKKIKGVLPEYPSWVISGAAENIKKRLGRK